MNIARGQSETWLAEAVRLRDLFAADAAENDRRGGRPVDQIGHLKESGLLTIGIPRQYGGGGATWSTILRIVRELAKADGSVGHLFGYHYNFIHLLQTLAAPRQRDYWLTASAERNWLWGNSVNSFSKSLFGRREAGGWILNGRRPFSSGSHVADVITIAWEDEVTGERHFTAVRAGHPGVTILDDWDGIGQRQTGSGTVTYENVRVEDDEVFSEAALTDAPIGRLGPLHQQSVLLNVFIGSAWGALEEARRYTLTKSRPWVHSGHERHVDDPWVKRVYGELWTRLRAAELLADVALQSLSAAWAEGSSLSAEARGEAAIDVAAANVHAGEVALDVTSRVFEVMGARSATRANGFDRYWRNVRTHTLHNPAEYKTRNVGHWYLTGDYPDPGTFQ